MNRLNRTSALAYNPHVPRASRCLSRHHISIFTAPPRGRPGASFFVSEVSVRFAVVPACELVYDKTPVLGESLEHRFSFHQGRLASEPYAPPFFLVVVSGIWEKHELSGVSDFMSYPRWASSSLSSEWARVLKIRVVLSNLPPS